MNPGQLLALTEFHAAFCDLAGRLAAVPEPSSSFLEQSIRDVCLQHRLPRIPTKVEVWNALSMDARERWRAYLRLKPVRTASGVAVITAMTRPFRCPHGTCIFCPGGPHLGTPQSYVGSEPATLQGREVEYDPYRQVAGRLRRLRAAGHCVDKCELIILGGTFLSTPPAYQEQFVKGCFDGLNREVVDSLEEAQRRNEHAGTRCVGLTIETKPDWCRRSHVDWMLRYGATRVELGVQALDDAILRLTNRGHSVADVVEGFRVARDAGFKIVAHMMPGLPGATPDQDIGFFDRLFDDEALRPDMLKIYPTLVTRGTGLYGWHRAGLYQPYPLDVFVRIVATVKARVPLWVRINRVQREIPAQEIVAGVRAGNLRQLVLAELERQGQRCRCIRCREAGLRRLHDQLRRDELTPRLFRQSYRAGEGEECFLAIEDAAQQVLFGFLRLRYASPNAHRPEVQGQCVIRELHVYGQAVPLGGVEADSWQHRGFGAQLLTEAERIAREHYGVRRLLVLSAVGTRAYYRRHGYEHAGPYMAKPLG